MFSVFVPHKGFLASHIQQCNRLPGNKVVRLFMPSAGARTKKAKINLMDCICLCSEVEMKSKHVKT